MKQFDIYSNNRNEIIAVSGKKWSWGAFFFGWIWALSKRMYLLGVGTIVAIWGLFGIMYSYDIKHFGHIGPMDVESFRNIVFVTMIIYGAFGNKWWKKSLSKKGYQYKRSVTSESPANAIEAFKRSRLAKNLHPATASPQSYKPA